MAKARERRLKAGPAARWTGELSELGPPGRDEWRAAAQPSRGLGDAVKPAAVRAGERSLAAARSPGEASEAWPRPA